MRQILLQELKQDQQAVVINTLIEQDRFTRTREKLLCLARSMFVRIRPMAIGLGFERRILDQEKLLHAHNVIGILADPSTRRR